VSVYRSRKQVIDINQELLVLLNNVSVMNIHDQSICMNIMNSGSAVTIQDQCIRMDIINSQWQCDGYSQLGQACEYYEQWQCDEYSRYGLFMNAIMSPALEMLALINDHIIGRISKFVNQSIN